MDQKRYIDFYDMIDGGGAGQTGDKFEGGGLFSALANLVADPYGSKDPERMQKLQQMRGLLDTGMDMGGSAPTPPQVINPAPDYATMPVGEVGRGVKPAQASSFDPRNFAPNTEPTFSSGTMPSNVGRSNAAMDMPYNNQQAMPGYNMPQMDIFQQAAKSVADELGNAFYMMPQEEQLMRIQQRVDMMRGM
jgi:hypothetical protein